MKKNERQVRIIIIKEIHLMNNFKANLFIENDILNFEKIDIAAFKNTTYIESCEIIISISIQTK